MSLPGIFSAFRPQYARVLTYMLQSSEYQPLTYLRWFWRTQDFGRVMTRRQLRLTVPARLLLGVLSMGMFLQFSIGVGLVLQGTIQELQGAWQFGVALILSYPIVWAHLIILPLALGRLLIVGPWQAVQFRRARRVFAKHPALRIAIAGSYGKTSMKELLTTVLSEAKKVVATPANRNVSISHARFTAGLQGDEDVLLIEYGEGRPGDIARFARRTLPTHAIITGLAPAHLDSYGDIAAAGRDIFSIKNHVSADKLYVNADSALTADFIDKQMQTYSAKGALGWKVTRIKVRAESTSFTLSKAKRRVHLNSGLLGRHNVGPLAMAASLALQLGLSDEQVIAGIGKTKPFEHRMQPRVVSGGLIIDDTYNGNLEGVRAGAALLRELPARRKWYVTPGLVEQGRDSQAIHHQVGQLIAAAKPDIVVLMSNSVQAYIYDGLRKAGYEGEVRVEQQPLEFYTNLPHFIAAGDVVLMQNDWSDNYS